MRKQGPVARYAALFFTLLISSAVLLIGAAMLRENAVDLQNAVKDTGRIGSRQIGKYFSFTLTGSSPTYYVYRPSRNYDDLQNSLAIGDSITVYADNSATANLQVGQIEKDGRVVVDKELLEGQNTVGGVIALLGGLGMIGAGVWQFKRSKRQNHRVSY